MTAVADTSPLLALASLNLLHLLPTLFGRVVVPPAVFAEATERRPDAPDARLIRRAVEIGVLQLENWLPRTASGAEPEWLGPGEREAIAMALEVSADWLILDDRAARRYAAARGLTVIGSVRILELAREAGLIDRVTPLLEQLRTNGFRLSDAIVALVRTAERDLEP